MIKDIKFISKASAERINPTPNLALISISEPGEEKNLSSDWNNKLDLVFHDTGACANNGHNWFAVDGYDGEIKPFDIHHARAVVDYTTKLMSDDINFNLIIHCHAGISRSAAVAKFVSEITLIEFPINYTVYNKHVFSLLRQSFYGDAYIRIPDEDDSYGSDMQDIIVVDWFKNMEYIYEH